MKTSRSAEVFPKDVSPVGIITEKKAKLSPLFSKYGDLFNALGDARKIKRADLSNLLNSIHFVSKSLYALLHHPSQEETILARAYPEPCLGETLKCRWADELLPGSLLKTYDFLHLIIDDGRFVVLVPAALDNISGDSFSVHLPEISYAVNRRRGKRYTCRDMDVEILQNNLKMKGEMVDFNPEGFRIRVNHHASCSSNRFRPDVPVTIHMLCRRKEVFSASCQCIRQEEVLYGTDIVLAPEHKKRNCFSDKQIRNPRLRLVPSPTLIFEHPFFKKRIQLDVADVSTLGFCVYEEADKGILMEDLVIPKMSIEFASSLRLNCSAKVIYRRIEEGKGIRCGLMILDMDIGPYSRLTHILTKALDPHAYIFNEVDIDALWEFFFDTGFIYPKKYRAMFSHREEIKETNRKLYQENSDIARHFTYQRNGEIYGHISMVRAYEKCWMIHHHAARSVEGKKAGFIVLKQILHYLIDMCRLPSANMDYVMCYFRPENKFPDRVYGDFTTIIGNRRICSLDVFSYLLHSSHSSEGQMPSGWSLQKCSKQDQWESSRFYNRRSGGLFLDIIYTKHKTTNNDSVEAHYSRIGLIRKWRTYSLKCHNKLKAVMIVNQSDPGLNFSELLNSITIQVTDYRNLTWKVLSAAINQLTFIYQKEKIPILIYPHDYLNGEKNLHETKKYVLFVLEARLIRDFALFLQRKFKIQYWK